MVNITITTTPRINVVPALSEHVTVVGDPAVKLYPSITVAEGPPVADGTRGDLYLDEIDGTLYEWS